MKKKPEIKHLDGFKATDDIATVCDSCDKWLNIGDAVYWREIKGKSQIFCRGCADKP